MGILGYELLVGHPPFERESRSETYEQIMYRRPQYPEWISDQSRSFISAALTKVYCPVANLPHPTFYVVSLKPMQTSTCHAPAHQFLSASAELSFFLSLWVQRQQCDPCLDLAVCKEEAFCVGALGPCMDCAACANSHAASQTSQLCASPPLVSRLGPERVQPQHV